MLYSLADTVTPMRAARQVRNLFKLRNNLSPWQSPHASTVEASPTTPLQDEVISVSSTTTPTHSLRVGLSRFQATHASTSEMVPSTINEARTASLGVTPTHTHRSVDILS